MEGLILNLVSGAVGGNVVGRLIGSLNQGTVINSIAGFLAAAWAVQFWGCWAHPIWPEWQVMPRAWTLAHCWVRWPVVALVGVYYWRLWALCAQKWDKPPKTTLKWGETWFAPLA